MFNNFTMIKRYIQSVLLLNRIVHVYKLNAAPRKCTITQKLFRRNALRSRPRDLRTKSSTATRSRFKYFSCRTDSALLILACKEILYLSHALYYKVFN